MPKDTPQVDHRAEALRWLAEKPRGKDCHTREDRYVQTALVHASLAIAEGQKRVAEAIEIGGFGTPPDGLPSQTGLEVVLQRAAAALVRRGFTPEQVVDSARIGAEREAARV